jgi:hypothetical protein
MASQYSTFMYEDTFCNAYQDDKDLYHHFIYKGTHTISVHKNDEDQLKLSLQRIKVICQCHELLPSTPPHFHVITNINEAYSNIIGPLPKGTMTLVKFIETFPLRRPIQIELWSETEHRLYSKFSMC